MLSRDSQPSRRLAVLVQVSTGYAGIAVLIVQGILLVPVYLHFVGTRLYGLWLGTGGVVSWLSVLDLGIAGLMGQRIASAYGRGDRDRVGLYYLNGLCMQLAAAVLLLCSAAVISWALPPLLRAVGHEVSLLRWTTFLASVSLGISFAINAQQNTASALQRPLVPGVAGIVGSVVGATATVLMLYRDYGLFALPVGAIIGNIVTLSISTIYVNSVLLLKIGGHLAFDRSVLKEMLLLSPALLVGRLGNALVGRVEPTLIAAFLTPELAVAFSLAKRLPEVAQTALNRILGATAPGLSHVYAAKDLRKASEVCRQLASVILWGGAGMMAAFAATNRSVISLWVGPDQFIGQPMTFLIGISTLVLVFNNGATYLLGAIGDIGPPSVMLAIESLLRLALVWLLLPHVGVYALALAPIVSAGAFTLVYIRRLADRLSTRIQIGRALVKVVAALSTMLLGYFLSRLLSLHDWPLVAGTWCFILLTASGVAFAVDTEIRGLLRTAWRMTVGALN